MPDAPPIHIDRNRLSRLLSESNFIEADIQRPSTDREDAAARAFLELDTPKRNGTATLFATLNVLKGKVIEQCMQRHRHQEFLRFLNNINRETPVELDVHVILDNYGSHKHPKVMAWLKRHPRFHFHFRMTHATATRPSSVSPQASP